MKLDHVIYGTFPELPGSQQVVYKSPGITAELESWLIQQYDALGDCKTEEFKSSLTLIWKRDVDPPLATLTKVTHVGNDFSGRWGALLRHTAVITMEQFRQFHQNLEPVRELLVSQGTAEELSQSTVLDVQPSIAAAPGTELLATIDLNNFTTNLRKILSGERLIVYADLNTGILTDYMQKLLLLIPYQMREKLSWSEFAFHSLTELDLSAVYSSRYSAPESDNVEFQSDGDNHLGETKLDNDEIEEYLNSFETALRSKDQSRIEELLSTTPITQSP